MWNIKIECIKGAVYIRNNGKFIARFRYADPKKSANHFVDFLVKNFTPAEYDAAVTSGMAPVVILNTKGFVSYNMMKCQGVK